MLSRIRRLLTGDRVRKLADIHDMTITCFTVTPVAFSPEGDHHDIVALEYGREVGGNLCFHSANAALNGQRRDAHAFVVEYKEAASEAV